MDPLTFFLAGLLVLRIILDLTTSVCSHWLFDVLYVALFLVMGSMVLLADHQDSRTFFGYVSLLIAIVWALYGMFRYNKKKQANQDIR